MTGGTAPLLDAHPFSTTDWASIYHEVGSSHEAHRSSTISGAALLVID